MMLKKTGSGRHSPKEPVALLPTRSPVSLRPDHAYVWWAPPVAIHGLGSSGLELHSPDVYSLLRSVSEHFSTQSLSQDELHMRRNEEVKRLLFFQNQGYALQTCHARTWLHTIYKGTRLTDGRPVAVKLLTLENFPEVVRAYEIEQAHMVQRFRREIRILSRVRRQKGVVTIVGSGEISGLPYHVCSWVEGQPLCEILANGKRLMNSRDKLTIMLCAARTVRNLHDANIVHRDIAPDHLYLISDNRTRIIDFGMAELVNENSPSDGRRYIYHDIFATGLMLCEIWLGRTCFSYGHPDLPKQVLYALRDPTMASRLSPISGIVGRAMVCDPRVAARASGNPEPYTKIADFITDLEAILESTPSTGSETRLTEK
jgi:serine/threonine protein kinase